MSPAAFLSSRITLSNSTSVWMGLSLCRAPIVVPDWINEAMPRRFHKRRKNAAVDSLYCIVMARFG
jgi:hypothetical protein